MNIRIVLLVRVVLIGCLLSGAGKIWAEEEVATSPVPEWVTNVVIPEVSKTPNGKIQNGVHYLLLDTQVKVGEEKAPDYFFRMAENIINQEGVDESSQISINYDPVYQKVVLHSINVIRNGEVLNKINTARMDYIQREEEMSELIYSGQITLNILLDDIRVGDVVEYSYTRSGMNPVYQGLFAYSFNLNWSVPLESHFLRILWEKPNPLQYSIVNSDLELKRRNLGDANEFILQDSKIDPLKSDDDTPSWFSPWGAVYFSESETWEDVGIWGRGLYEDVYHINEDISKLADNIKSNSSDKGSQISAALKFVQDEVRYLGIELGENSHKPRLASETLRNRYGDCKDKTVLFLTLLKELGVIGYPALVNTESKLKNKIPSVRSFDHVITYFEFEGKEYWVDPTRSYQHGALDTIHQPDYGKALVLRPGVDNLTEMHPTFAKFGVFVKDEFNIPTEGSVAFKSKTVNYGWNAERQRRGLASNGRDSIQNGYLEFFEGYYPGIEVETIVEFEDDLERNIFSYAEQYRIEEFWENKPERERYEVDFYANIVSSAISKYDDRNRRHPLELLYPELIEQIIEVNFEGDDWSFDNEFFEEDNKFFHFKNTVDYQEATKQLRLEYSYQSKIDHVKAEDYKSYIEAIERVENHLSYGVYKRYTNSSIVNEGEGGLVSQLSVATFIYIYASFYVLLIFMWRYERWKNPVKQDAIYYPVSLGKLIAMWIFTFGLFGVYWFYRNFKYIRVQENSAIMPVARGIFNEFWYFPLWNNLKEDSVDRFGVSHLPGKKLAILLAIIFLVSSILGHITDYVLLSLLISALAILPLANYMIFVNGAKSSAEINNSRWGIRHVLLILLGLPLYVIQIGGEVGLTPSEAVIDGSEISADNIKFMQRQGIIKPKDEVEYFYSDALLFVRDDGNGFTQRHVFSYWKEEGVLQKEVATYDKVEDIQVEWGGLEDNTTVTILRKDGSDFILYVSGVDGRDKLFVNALKAQWQSIQ
ncbi:DUF3857 domain-containing transglutaminase family protein [Microbulbifer variabilis]|uniref:DUF3857 domain-containing transglutaminase family protein n=1 Tax=Microbulbifer variabilis TaxID=266805 RepID=UPI0003810D79|nr:DUF3857 and transglutaminase domain-containing protein [Microbulbifer variabilis]